MSRKFRILLGVVILVISLALLVWGFAPTRKETITRPIAPSDLQLPLRFDVHPPFSASPTSLEVGL